MDSRGGRTGRRFVVELAGMAVGMGLLTGRTGDGGALVTRYALDAAGSVVVTVHTITATGVDTRTTASCTPPPGSWSTGIEGRVVLAGPDPAYC